MPKVPWPDDQYVVDEDTKTVWLRGSFMRAMALHHRPDDPVPGYEVKLCTQSELKEKKNA